MQTLAPGPSTRPPPLLLRRRIPRPLRTSAARCYSRKSESSVSGFPHPLMCRIGGLRRGRKFAERPAPSADDRPSTTERGRAELAHADPRAGSLDSTSVAPTPPEDSKAVQDASSSLLLAEVGVIRHWAPPPADVPHRRPQAWAEPEKRIYRRLGNFPLQTSSFALRITLSSHSFRALCSERAAPSTRL